VHTTDGLNAMVYPRCWGTRYCSAACPYQARTFNFRDYARQSRAATKLPTNPDVTVRSRGVMEKCTYCVQRINAAKQSGSDTPQTACQQACPVQAIRLIDLNTTPPPHEVITSYDTPGTRPRTLYI
jgi:molybdopterin-containing oxidoreductase family iron-sulfur binding subunit